MATNELAYKGNSGRSFTTSSVPFLPNAGLALILNSPFLRLVKPSIVLSSSVVSTSVGLPIALSEGRLNRFHILDLPDQLPRLGCLGGFWLT